MTYCKRSGYCCIAYDVIIMLKESGGKWGLYHKPGNVHCPNLSFDPTTGDASCSVHNEPWYFLTPCFSFNNPEIDPDACITKGCRVGPYKRELEGGCLSKLWPKPKKELERLDDGEEFLSQFEEMEITQTEK